MLKNQNEECYKLNCVTREKDCIGEKNLRRHMSPNHGSNIQYQCNQCDDRYKDAEDLQCHIQIVHLTELKTYKCEKCDGEFESEESLNHHINTHHKSSPLTYQCQQCEYRVNDENLVTEHTLTRHRQSKGFHCQPCDKTFETAKDIPIHIKTHHSTG